MLEHVEIVRRDTFRRLAIDVGEMREQFVGMKRNLPVLFKFLEPAHGCFKSTIVQLGVCLEFVQKITGSCKEASENHILQSFRTHHQSDSVFRA